MGSMRCLTVGVISAMAAAVAWGQGVDPTLPGFGEALDVQEVVVEVQVRDGEGRTVAGLDRDDFAVVLGGRPMEVTSVRRVEGGGEPVVAVGERGEAAAGIREPARPQPLRLVLFVDNLHTAPASRLRTFQALGSFLQESLGPEDEVMVASYDYRVRVLQPFTSDLQRIGEALVAAEEPTAQRLTVGVEERRVMEQIQQVQNSLNDGKVAAGCTVIEGLALQYATQQYRSLESTIASMADFVDSLSGLPGRKVVVHVSDGIQLVAGKRVYDYILDLCDGSGISKGVDGALDKFSLPHDLTKIDTAKVRLDMHRFDLSDPWRDLAARANRQNVTFYTVEASGARAAIETGAYLSHRLASSETDISALQNLQDTLVLLAEETGGRAILNHNQLRQPLAAMMAELQSYYEVSFRVDGPRKGYVLPLAVDVDRPGARVKHRKSLRFKSRQEQVSDGVLSALLHGAVDNPFALRLGVVDREPVEGDLMRVRIRLEIPLEALVQVPQGDRTGGLFTVFVAALDEEARRTPVRQATVPVCVAGGGEEGAREYTYEIDMSMRPGDHLVSVGVLDELGGEASWLVERITL